MARAQRTLAGLTMSLDGYITGPDDKPGAGLGIGGERLHYWVFGGPWSYQQPPTGVPSGVDQDYLQQTFDAAGAWIVGRTMHDVVDGWGEDPGFTVPVYVVTHRPHESVVKGDSTFHFVTGGIHDAHQRALAAAEGKNVIIMGGANLVGQYLDAGLIDEITVTLAPVLVGAGKRMFDHTHRDDLAFERIQVVESPYATHIRYRVSAS